MIGFPNMQQTLPSYNSYNPSMSMMNNNNYNSYNANTSLMNNSYNANLFQNNTSIYPTSNNYANNTSIYPTSNSFTNNSYTNIINNYNFAPQQMYQQPMMQQQQMFAPQQMYQQPMMQQQQMFAPQQMYQQPMMQQQQMFAPQVQQQNNSGAFMQQIMGLILPLLMQLLGSGATNTANADDQVAVDQTEIAVENKGVWGDPHFETTGKDGKAIKFDQKGKVGDTYNVFEGDGYEVDARYDDWNGGYAIMGKAQVKAGADTIEVTKEGQTTINGKVIKDGSSIDLNDGTKVTVNGKNAIIESRDGDSKINITNGGNYLNVDPEGKFAGLGGILGTAIDSNKALTEEEAEKFNVTKTNKIA